MIKLLIIFCAQLHGIRESLQQRSSVSKNFMVKTIGIVLLQYLNLDFLATHGVMHLALIAFG
jgi:hypothetical protein